MLKTPSEFRLFQNLEDFNASYLFNESGLVSKDVIQILKEKDIGNAKLNLRKDIRLIMLFTSKKFKDKILSKESIQQL
jgi:hypothetical protein